jgi:hypothetical protein
MKLFAVLLACLVSASVASAECRTTLGGRKICDNGQGAATYNPRTGTATKSQTNQNGVTTTQSSRGGQAKTKNGKGVYHAPNGKTCVKTANNKGCN